MRETILTLLIGSILLTSCTKEPESFFTASETNVYPNTVIEFQNLSEDADSYLWEFGDGSSSTEQNPTHAYNNPGSFNVKLTSYSKNKNKKDKYSLEITVDEINTKEFMTGVWELTEAKNASDVSIINELNNYFPGYLHLDDMNSYSSTLGPLFLDIIFGYDNKDSLSLYYDDLFKYEDLTLSEGEWYIYNGAANDFTFEIHTQFFELSILENLFNSLNLDMPEVVDGTDIKLYSRYKYVSVAIDPTDFNTMTWQFTDTIECRHITKDQYGDPVLYQGMSFDEFEKVTLTFTRRNQSIVDLVNEYIQP